MKNQSRLFTRWYQESAGFNFTVIHKKGKKNSDALSRFSHMVESPTLEEDEYAEFYEIDKSVIRFEGGVNEIPHIQRSLIEIAREQSKDKVWNEVISWVEKGQLPEKVETRGKTKEVLVAPSMFDLAVFKMKDGVLMFTKAANRNQVGEVWWICILESMVREVWSLCHQSDLGGHRGPEGTLNKLLKGFFKLSARQKLVFLNGGGARTGEHVPSLMGYIVEKLYVDLVSMSDTMRGNRYLLTAKDSFIRYCRAYPIPNKGAHTMAKVLMDHHFNIYGFPDQLHSDSGKEFVNNLWR